MKICPQCDARYDSPEWVCPSCGATPPLADGYPALAIEFANAGDGFNPEYFAQLAGLEKGNFWFQSRNRLILMLLRRHAPALTSFMEIGCGTGFVLSNIASEYPAAALMGAEIFSTGLAHAARRVPSAKFIQMDARNIPFEAQFDALGAFDVIEHIEEDEAVLAQINKALKPGGIMLLTVPQHPALWSKQDEKACHVRRYTAAELESKVTAAGFEILDSGSFVSLLLPLMWLSRSMANRDSNTEHDAMAELRIGKLMNMTLKAVMSVEMMLTRIGVRFPAGGSRFLVARKVPISKVE
ncbi:MAG: methyltransferase domain-containing protein [Gallionella sp.]|nr:methyltransferase domain-containing protein [Gallionella sp.]